MKRGAFMELKNVQTFRVLAEELSFTRTAERLNYAQSSVSAQIQSLEEELGVLLVERSGKRIRLTDAGTQFLSYAHRLLNLADEAHEVVGNSSEVVGTLTVGSVESLCTYRLAPVLKAYRAHFPQVELIFRTGICRDLRQAVWHGSLDLAVTLESPCQDPGLHCEILRDEPMRVVAPVHHPLARALEVGPGDLEHETLLVTEPGCSYRVMFESALESTGIHHPRVEFFSVEAIKQCVQAGLGVSLLPSMAVQEELEAHELVELPWNGPEFPVVSQLVWRHDKWLSPAARGFIEMTRRYFSTALQDVDGL
ncbi:LysR family transcriptional regulator [Sulfobacillus sp. hq2]|nr:LysR family transcriptional regulator [Sulfobacillus sp. hq2]